MRKKWLVGQIIPNPARSVRTIEYEVIDPVLNVRVLTKSRQEALARFEKKCIVYERHNTVYRHSMYEESRFVLTNWWHSHPQVARSTASLAALWVVATLTALGDCNSFEAKFHWIAPDDKRIFLIHHVLNSRVQ